MRRSGLLRARACRHDDKTGTDGDNGGRWQPPAADSEKGKE